MKRSTLVISNPRPEHAASPEMPREQLLVRGFAEINWEAILDSLAGLSGLLGH